MSQNQAITATSRNNAAQQQQNSADNLMLFTSSKDNHASNQPRLANSQSNFIAARASNQLSNQLDTSNLVNNHESTRMID